MLILKGLMCDQNAKKPKPKKLLPRFYFIFYTLLFSLCAILLFGERKEKPYEKDKMYFLRTTL